MICVNHKIRITQSMNEKKRGEFKVYNAGTGEIFKINQSCYSLIDKVNNSSFESIEEMEAAAKKITRNYREIIQKLFQKGLIRMCVERRKNVNILPPLAIRYPLTSLALEITQNCNLHCKHCYGQFGKAANAPYLSLEYIKALKPQLDKLHTRNIALTGGEVLVHREFEEIARFLLENGFQLTIFTNGYSYQRLEHFLESVKEYHMSVTISLDGTEAIHNEIRGREDAFQNTIESLKLIHEDANVDGGIATVVMRENVEDIQQLKQNIKEQFPRLGQSCRLIIPTQSEKQKKSAFSTEELEAIYQKLPEIFEMQRFTEKQKYRCAGGIASAALDAEKHLKICAAAQEKVFWIGDLNERSLYDTWVNPSDTVKCFRKEKRYALKKCRRCSLKKKCNVTNCRLQAWEYTGNMNNPNPIVCFGQEKTN